MSLLIDEIDIDNLIQTKINKAKSIGYIIETMAFSYARVSTKEQALKGNSVNDQKDDAQNYAESNNLFIVHTFSGIESAFKEDRVNFNLMLDKTIQYNIKNIIFKNTDRLGRNDLDWPRCKKLAREQDFNIHLYELNTMFNKDSTAEEEMFLDNTSIYAKYWSNKISQGVKRSYRNKVKRKQAITAPMGYRSCEKIKKWILDKKFKSIVERIFHLYDISRMTIENIANLLNAEGVKTPRKKKFHKSTIHNILRNPFYAGYFIDKYNDNKLIKGDHPTYISKEKFDERIRIMESKFVGHRKVNTDYLFTKFAKCHCGRMWTGQENKSGKVYYSHKCIFESDKRVLIHEADLMKGFINDVSKHIFSEEKTDFIKYVFKNSIQSKNRVAVRKEDEINNRIMQLKKEKSRLIELFMIEEIKGKDEIIKKMNSHDESINILRDELKTIDSDLSRHEHKVIEAIDYIRDFSRTFGEANESEKVELVKSIALGIYTDGVKVEVEWLPPFSFLLNKKIAGYINNGGNEGNMLSTVKGASLDDFSNI